MIKYILICFFLISSVRLAFSQISIEAGKKYQINSEIMEEEREVWIGLPDYFDSTTHYPVIYVMDAEWQFGITYATVKELASNDKIPDHIVVGIPHIDQDHRLMDMTFTNNTIKTNGEEDQAIADFFSHERTGGGFKFYSYLVDEVIPFVESTYLTNKFDVYIGHSLSGYYGAYLLAMNSPFNAFQLYDPSIWYDRGEAIMFLKDKLPKRNRSNVYIASANGGREREQNNIDTHLEFHEYIKSRGISSELRVYDNEGHGSVRLPSLIDGLSKLYDGFSIGYIFPTDKITVQQAQDHYSAFSEKVNFRFTCPAGAYRWIGHANHAQENWKEAIKAFTLCMDMFQDDARFQTEVAESYFGLQEYIKSLEHYEELLLLDPENESASSRVEELKGLIKKSE